MIARPSGRARRLRRLRPFLVLFLLLSVSASVIGPSAPSVAQTGDTPPAADYSVWREDEIFVPLASTGKITSSAYEFDDSAYPTPGQPLGYCQPREAAQLSAASGPQMGAAAGRLTSAYADQVVVAYPTAGPNLAVSLADGCDPATTATLPPAITLGALGQVTNLPFFYDVATSDLDKYRLNGELYRDEVVVAYAGTSAGTDPFPLVVAVVDYTMTGTTPPTAPVVTSTSIAAAIPRNIVPTVYDIAPIPLAVTTGNFDGDADNVKEIAVAYLTGGKTLGVATFRYATTESAGTLTHALILQKTLSSAADDPSEVTGTKWDPVHWIGSLDAAAGDLDGNGTDELSVAASVQGKTGLLLHPNKVGTNLKTFESDAALTLTQISPNSASTIPYADVGEFGARVQVVSGLFKFAPNLDPAISFGPNRRQIALATNGSSGTVDLRTIVYDANLAPTVAGSMRIAPTDDPAERLKFWMAAGAFQGLRSTTSPGDVVWSLAFMTWDLNGQVLLLFGPDAGTGALVQTPIYSKVLSTTAYPHSSGSTSAEAPIVAYDHGKVTAIAETETVLYGDAQQLGTPMHIYLQDVLATKAIIQEPPKHAYWDKDLQEVVTVNWFDSTYSELTSTQKDTFNTTHRSTSDWSLGADAKSSVKVEGKLPIPLFSVEASVEVAASFAYDYQQHEADYNSSNASLEQGRILKAVHDDFIAYTFQKLHVWRYPVYGLTLGTSDDGSAIKGYLDIVLPDGTPQQTYTTGTNAFWYQPLHENGNVLSYPVTDAVIEGSVAFDPQDMGTFRIPCPSVDDPTCVEDSTGAKWKEVSGLPLGKFGGTLGGVADTEWVTMTTETGDGKEHQYTHSLKESLDVTVTAKASFAGSSVSNESSIGLHSGQSWGEVTTQETTAAVTEGVKIVLDSSGRLEAYDYNAVLYVTHDGTWKVAFATAPPLNPQQTGYYFWNNHYIDPDPALNLPTRFTEVWSTCPAGSCLTGWQPNTNVTRNKMRGFFVRSATPDPVTGEYLLMGDAPVVGETVRLEARVYNYSLQSSVDNLEVRFVAVPLDARGNEVPSLQQTIGETTVVHLDPRGVDMASVEWNTAGFGPDLSTAVSKTWNVHVILDPDNAISNENYESESVDPTNWPGQNNDGWYPVTIAAPPPAAPHDVDRLVKLEKDAMGAIVDNGKLKTQTVQAEVGTPLEIRVLAGTNLPGTSYRRVQLYDGDPNAGGELVGEQQVFVGDPAGKTVTFWWTPLMEGQHQLYAKLIPIDTDDPSGNTIDSLKVVVQKAKKVKDKTK